MHTVHIIPAGLAVTARLAARLFAFERPPRLVGGVGQDGREQADQRRRDAVERGLRPPPAG